jgi:hypothetical protein
MQNLGFMRHDIHFDLANPDSHLFLLYQPLELGISTEKEWWAHLDSNQGPTGYEPVALTN